MEILLYAAGVAGAGFLFGLWQKNKNATNPTLAKATPKSVTRPKPVPTIKASLTTGPAPIQLTETGAQGSLVNKGIGLAGTGLGAAAGIGAASHATWAAGAAIPIAGAVLAGIAIAYSIVSANHQKAVRNEAADLNLAVPLFYQSLVAIIGAVAARQISVATANADIKTAVEDYWRNVASMTEMAGVHGRGQSNHQMLVDGLEGKASGQPKGHYAGQLLKGYVQIENPSAPGAKNYQNHIKDKPCNGPCVIGREFIEPDALQTIYWLPLMVAGKHGRIYMMPIAPHAGAQGRPAIDIKF